MKSRAFLVTDLNEIKLGSVEIPEPEAGEVLIRTVATCVSPGTELRCMAGGQPGSDKRPFVPGYSNVGRVMKKAEGVSLKEGDLVLCGGTQKLQGANRLWGGHVEYAVTKAADCVPVPAGVDAVDAAFARLISISYHGYRMSNPKVDESVVVVGLGPIGMCSALLHNLSGARVACFDLYPERVELARSLGLDARVARPNLVDAAKAVFPQGADVVVDSTGSAGVLRQSILLGRSPDWSVTLRDQPRFVVQGSYPGDIVMDYNEAFMREYAILMPRDRTRFDTVASLELLARGMFPAKRLVGAALSPDKAPEIYKTLREEPQKMLTAAIRWS